MIRRDCEIKFQLTNVFHFTFEASVDSRLPAGWSNFRCVSKSSCLSRLYTSAPSSIFLASNRFSAAEIFDQQCDTDPNSAHRVCGENALDSPTPDLPERTLHPESAQYELRNTSPTGVLLPDLDAASEVGRDAFG